MRLKHNQLCPIHRRRDCCGRESLVERKRGSKWETVRPGVRRIRDEHADHPDGYRYKLSPAEMRKVINAKIIAQNGLCSICGLELKDYSDVVPDHQNPRGLGGARRDDRESNIGASHFWCNQEKGSQRIDPKQINLKEMNQ